MFQNASAAAAGTYTVTMTVGSCQLQATTVALSAAPGSPVASNNGPLCAGQDLQLSASTVPGVTYRWTGPGNFTSEQQNPLLPAAGTASAGTYSVQAIAGGCPSSPATTDVVIRPLPSATLSGSTTSCEGAAEVIQASLTGTPPWSLTWSDGLNQSALAASPAARSVDPITSTSYTVTAVRGRLLPGTASGEAAIKAIDPTCLRYSTVTPCRAIDTRNPAGPLGGPALQPRVARRFTIAGVCGIPPSAKAISVNLTITQPTSAGDLRVYPSDATRCRW